MKSFYQLLNLLIQKTNMLLCKLKWYHLVSHPATSGSYHEAGLPNITGSFHSRSYSNAGITNTRGAFHCEYYTTNQQIVSGSGEGSSQYTFDASRSSTIYGNSTTVQPPALTMLPIIKY